MFSEYFGNGRMRLHTFDAVLYKDLYGKPAKEEYGDVACLTFEIGDPARDNGKS